MMMELNTFDWTAVAAIGQVLASILTLLSLFMLWFQVRLAQRQVDQSSAQMKLAAEQIGEASRLADEARHQAIHPELILDFVDQEPIQRSHTTLRITNYGEGPSIDVMVFQKQEGKPREVVGQLFAVLGRNDSKEISVENWSTETLWVRTEYSNRLGRKFFKEWRFIATPGGAISPVRDGMWWD